MDLLNSKHMEYTRSNGYVDLSPVLKGRMKSYPRTKGRYNSSEMYFINSGSTKPEEWLNPAERSVFELLRMWKGIAAHNMVQDLLDKKHCEIKREHTWNGITVVGKVDYLPPEYPEEVWEFKSSENLMDVSKPWHEYQVKLYCTMFERPRGVVLQPVENKDGLYLKEIGYVTRDDQWFADEMAKLYAFHLTVEEILRKK